MHKKKDERISTVYKDTNKIKFSLNNPYSELLDYLEKHENKMIKKKLQGFEDIDKKFTTYVKSIQDIDKDLQQRIKHFSNSKNGSRELIDLYKQQRIELLNECKSALGATRKIQDDSSKDLFEKQPKIINVLSGILNGSGEKIKNIKNSNKLYGDLSSKLVNKMDKLLEGEKMTKASLFQKEGSKKAQILTDLRLALIGNQNQHPNDHGKKTTPKPISEILEKWKNDHPNYKEVFTEKRGTFSRLMGKSSEKTSSMQLLKKIENIIENIKDIENNPLNSQKHDPPAQKI